MLSCIEHARSGVRLSPQEAQSKTLETLAAIGLTDVCLGCIHIRVYVVLTRA